MRLLTLTLTLLLLPTASAWPWEGNEIRIPTMRDGDLRHFAFRSGGTAEYVVEVEGAAMAQDKWGVDRDVVSFRVDFYDNGELKAAERCSVLARGGGFVRAELLAGASYGGITVGSSSFDMFGREVSAVENLTGVVRFDGGYGCAFAPDPFAGRTLRKGDRVTLQELLPHERAPDVVSEPARRSELLGRHALVFSFALREAIPEASPGARIEFTFADGLPGIARQVLVVDGTEAVATELWGYQEGQGEGLILTGDETVPEATSATMLPFDPLGFDDRAYGLPFSYDEAFAVLVSDPRSGMRAWLDAHPNAYLATATTPAGDSGSVAAGMRETGSWALRFEEGATGHVWYVKRSDRVDTPLGPVELPAPTYDVMDFGEVGSFGVIRTFPDTIVPSEESARLAYSAGIQALAPRIQYFLHGSDEGRASGSLYLTDVVAGAEDEEGRTLQVDPTTGEIESVYATRYETDAHAILPALREFDAPTSAEAIDAVPIPAPLASTTVAITAIAVFALVVKLVLLPLYTRLRRDRLLDNPVRARIFDRIRTEPGIHLAELEEFLGIGKGATKHHVDQLVRHKLVFVLETDGYSRVYASGHVPMHVARRLAVMRAGSNARVYEAFATRPTMSLREAARELGLSAPSVHRAKQRLIRAGLLPAAPEADLVPSRSS